MKPKVALVRGKFLNKYELQFYEPLVNKYKILGIGSLTSFHDRFSFPTVLLPSLVDIPDFPYKMPILNRLSIDANILFGLEGYIKHYDIVHTAETYYHYTHQAVKLKKSGHIGKLVISVFENIPFAGEGIWGRRKFKRAALKYADHIIAVSQKTKQALLIEGCPENKITIINQHIDTNRFKPKKRVKNNKEIRLLFSGRLEKYKGVYDVIKAAKIIVSDKSIKEYKIRLLIVGKGTEYKELLKLEKELGIDDFIDHKYVSYEDMPQIYQQSDIFIAPSKSTPHWQEQFSTVLLEAKSTGLAIVSTNSGGIAENVKDAGILVREGDHKGIAQACIRLIKNPHLRAKLGTKARNDALKNFDIKLGAKKVDSVYQSVINE